MPISSHSTRGRCHETSCWQGGMRRLRAGLVTPLPGGLGTRIGRVLWRLRRDCWTGTGHLASSQETRTRGQKSRDGAPKGATCPQGQVHLKEGAPVGAPCPPSLLRGASKRPRLKRKGRRVYSGPAQRIRALALGHCPIGQWPTLAGNPLRHWRLPPAIVMTQNRA